MTVMDDEDNLDGEKCLSSFYDQYEPLEILGKGASSTVRRCIEKKTGLTYAVKVIDATESVNQACDIREATREEIRILYLCAERENIISIHDSFESETLIFLVTERCSNGELFDLLTTKITLSEKRTRVIMRQLLRAVEICHDANIVHRDVKPENILFDDDNNVKLSDFGFAKVIDSDTELRDLCGTPGYLAPEVLKVSMYENIDGYGRPCDIWACGVIMFILLAGFPPFWHRKQMVMLRMIMEGRYNLNTPEWSDMSSQAKDLISQLLVVDPQARLTATQALQHSFFECKDLEAVAPIPAFNPSDNFFQSSSDISKFNPRQKFKTIVHVICATFRIRNMPGLKQSIDLAFLKQEPYSVRCCRKLLDNGAYRMYNHWVKRGEKQSGLTLFENIKRNRYDTEADLTLSRPLTAGGK